MKLAAIDIGTNSVRLLISDVPEKGAPVALVRKTSITRLGEGISKSEALKSAAIERTLRVLDSYKDEIDRCKVNQVRATATSAVRDAKNSYDFLSGASQRLGVQVEVIDGREEAKLAFWGALSDFQPISRYQLVIDVGGGSTELILAENGCLISLSSLNIGSVRLTEAFIKNDPPSSPEVNNIAHYVRSSITQLAPFILGKEDVATIGVAGTATTLSAVCQNLTFYDPAKIHHSTLSSAEIERLLEKFISVPLKIRREITGLEPRRADVIIAGTIIFLETIRAAGSSELIVSERDMLDGLILSQIPGQTSPGLGFRKISP